MSSDYVWDQPLSPQVRQKVFQYAALDSQVDFTDFRVLDFGCGGGRYLALFASRIPKKNLYGTEISLERVIQVNRQGYNVLPVNPEGNYLAWKDESFDIVFSSNVLEHIPHPIYRQYLVEIHRVLKPEGRFIVGTPNYPIKRLYDMKAALTTNQTRYYLFDDPTHCNKLSIRRLETDLQNLFSQVHLEPTHILLEGWIKWLQKPTVRKRLRMLGNKVAGYCIK